MWTTLITSMTSWRTPTRRRRARARRRESEGLADELVYPGGLTTFEDSDEDARAAQRGDAKAPRDNQAAFFGVLAALAISLLAVVARIVSDAAAAALEGVAEVRSTLAQPRVCIAIVGFGVAAASIYRRVQTLIERRALAEDLLEAAVAALEDARRLPGSRARVPCDHLRDALIRARWPLAGAKRRAALKAWAIVIRELDSDARIRSVNVQVAGRRMKHFEYVARVRTRAEIAVRGLWSRFVRETRRTKTRTLFGFAALSSARRSSQPREAAQCCAKR